VAVCFCAASFGSGFLYLAARHSGENPPMALLSVLALITAVAAVGMVFVAAKLAGLERRPAPAPAPAHRLPELVAT
jgi:hypothetical protein